MADLLAFPFWDITQVIFAALPALLLSPGHALFFWLLTAFTAMQYRRLAETERALYGRTRIHVFPATARALAHGLLGGVLASYLLVFTGVALGGNDLAYLWPVALLLMLLQPRFLCFSYAATLVSLSSLLTGWPQVNIPGLVGLVAVLHVVEGILVWLGGDRGALPVSIRHRDGDVVGGFHVQRFWPVPLVAVLGMSLPPALQGEAIAMPDWWPLLGLSEQALAAQGLTLVLWPAAAALGYSDVAVSVEPLARSRRAAGHLLLYSLTLLLLAIAASRWAPLLWVAAVASGGLHEWMIQAGLRSEFGGQPRFRAVDDGVAVLDVFPGSFADVMGLRRGDVIRRVNGRNVANRRELADVLGGSSFFLAVTVTRAGRWLDLETNRFRPGPGALGVVPAPEPGDPALIQIGQGGVLTRWLSRLLKRGR
ncbi:MAG TPA: PDZ domain-containing protein [Bacillota bacterium]